MLTPEDIQSREFLVSLRGYDRDEVHAFLDEVADEFTNLLARPKGAPDDHAEPEPAVAPPPAAEPEPEAAPAPSPVAPADSASMSFAAIGAETQRILEAAHAAGEEIRRRAEGDADRLATSRLADAQVEVDGLRQEAGLISQQIQELISRRDAVGQRLRQARETVELALIELDAQDGQGQQGGRSVLEPEVEDVPEEDTGTAGVVGVTDDADEGPGRTGA